MIFRMLALLLAAVLPVMADCTDHARDFANPIDPAKLATLGSRGANPRIHKAVAILEAARRDGCSVALVASNGVFIAGYPNTLLAQMTRDALTRNHGIADKLGALTDAGLKDMRQGYSPAVKRGPYAGDKLSVDHIIPHALALELDNVVANLELMPLRMNQSKGDKVGARQYDYARKFYKAGLLSDLRLKKLQPRGAP